MNYHRLHGTRLMVSDVGFIVPALEQTDAQFDEAVATLKRAHRNHASLYWLEAPASAPLFKAAFAGEREEAVLALAVPAGPIAAGHAVEAWLETLETDWLDLVLVEAVEAEPALITETAAALEASDSVLAAGLYGASVAFGTASLRPTALPWNALSGDASTTLEGVLALDIEASTEAVRQVLMTPGIVAALVRALTLEQVDALTLPEFAG